MSVSLRLCFLGVWCLCCLLFAFAGGFSFSGVRWALSCWSAELFVFRRVRVRLVSRFGLFCRLVRLLWFGVFVFRRVRPRRRVRSAWVPWARPF